MSDDVDLYRVLVDERENLDRVLVYDMGAGTIDLSLFELKMTDGKDDLRIVARVGAPKGGNYLDYYLAKATYRLIMAQIEDSEEVDAAAVSLLDPEKLGVQNRSLQIEYKRFIKNHLKPALGGSHFNFEREDFEFFEYVNVIPVADILNSEEYQTYLTEVTDDLIGLLRRNCHEDGFTLQTLMLAGRGVQLPQLQERLQGALQYHFDSTPFPVRPQADKLKTMVAEGASIYAHTMHGGDQQVGKPTLPARFGLWIKPKRGLDQYVELLSPVAHPALTKRSDGTEEVFLQKELDVTRVHQYNIVQTFEQPSVVTEAVELKQEVNTLVTPLVAFEVGLHIPQGERDGLLQVSISTEGELRAQLNGNEARPVSMKDTDLEHNPIYQKSMWPYL